MPGIEEDRSECCLRPEPTAPSFAPSNAGRPLRTAGYRSRSAKTMGCRGPLEGAVSCASLARVEEMRRRDEAGGVGFPDGPPGRARRPCASLPLAASTYNHRQQAAGAGTDHQCGDTKCFLLISTHPQNLIHYGSGGRRPPRPGLATATPGSRAQHGSGVVRSGDCLGGPRDRRETKGYCQGQSSSGQWLLAGASRLGMRRRRAARPDRGRAAGRPVTVEPRLRFLRNRCPSFDPS
jgi:hypothetical protein